MAGNGTSGLEVEAAVGAPAPHPWKRHGRSSQGGS
jgi:hypothetical protein